MFLTLYLILNSIHNFNYLLHFSSGLLNCWLNTDSGCPHIHFDRHNMAAHVELDIFPRFHKLVHHLGIDECYLYIINYEVVTLIMIRNIKAVIIFHVFCYILKVFYLHMAEFSSLLSPQSSLLLHNLLIGIHLL